MLFYYLIKYLPKIKIQFELKTFLYPYFKTFFYTYLQTKKQKINKKILNFVYKLKNFERSESLPISQNLEFPKWLLVDINKTELVELDDTITIALLQKRLFRNLYTNENLACLFTVLKFMFFIIDFGIALNIKKLCSLDRDLLEFRCKYLFAKIQISDAVFIPIKIIYKYFFNLPEKKIIYSNFEMINKVIINPIKETPLFKDIYYIYSLVNKIPFLFSIINLLINFTLQNLKKIKILINKIPFIFKYFNNNFFPNKIKIFINKIPFINKYFNNNFFHNKIKIFTNKIPFISKYFNKNSFSNKIKRWINKIPFIIKYFNSFINQIHHSRFLNIIVIFIKAFSGLIEILTSNVYGLEVSAPYQKISEGPVAYRISKLL